MKKDKEMFRITIFTIIFTLILSSALPYCKVVSAAEGNTEIKFSINGGTGGEIKAGSDIEIDVDLNNLSNFYAGSLSYTYDNTLLEINSLEVSPKIKENNPYEVYKDKANNGNIARYGFTLMKGRNPINGSIRFMTIKAKAKKDGNLEINRPDVEYQLVQRIGDGQMENISGVQFSNGKEEGSEKTDGSNSSSKSDLTTSDEGNGTSDSNSGDVNGSGSNSSNNGENGSNGTKQDKAEGNGSDSKNEAIGASDSLEKSFDGSGSDSESNDVEKNSSHNYIYAIIALGFIVIVACGVFVYRKKRNKDKITIDN